MLGEANFSDHGANRLGASALMQGLADGYFVAPYTVANYLGGTTSAGRRPPTMPRSAPRRPTSQDRIDRVLKVKGKRTVREFHRAIGAICWDNVGMARNEEGLKQAIDEIRALRDEFWQDVNVPGEANNLNPGLDYAGRVADFMEFAEVLALDALERRESCGGHFREEYQTPDGEAQRNDDEFHVRRGLGIHGRRRPSRRCTRSRWCSRKCTRRRGATSDGVSVRV